MRFLYGCKTRENERRSGEILAQSRSAVYAELKKQGVRPYKVELAPGFLNWLQSLGKRTAAIVLLALGVACFIALWRGERDEAETFKDKATAFADRFENKTRRQVIGDAAIIEKGICNGWADIFPEEGERFLASFAIPGVSAGQRNNELRQMGIELVPMPE